MNAQKQEALNGKLEAAKAIYGENSAEVQSWATKLTNAKTEQQQLEAQLHPGDGDAGFHHQIEVGVGLLKAGAVPLLAGAGAQIERPVSAAGAEFGDLLFHEFAEELEHRLAVAPASGDPVEFGEAFEAGHHFVRFGN